jgi:Rho guanine nucleotide exchange factor 11
MKKENLMPREELSRLFPNLPELIEIHSKEPESLQTPRATHPTPHVDPPE